METVEYFLVHMRSLIESGEMSQADIANLSGIARQTINAYYKGRKTPGMTSQEAIATACGMPHIEFVQKGVEITKPTKVEAPAPVEKNTIDDLIDPMSIVPYAQKLAVQMTKASDEMRYWREIYEMLPVAAVVIRNNIVLYQNNASRVLGVATGGELCAHCFMANTESCQGENCSVRMTIATGQHHQELRSVGDEEYLLIASPIRYSGVEYVIVIATKTNRRNQ